MKRRIKVLYLLTIAAIVAFGWLEGQWLEQRYAAAVEEQEKAVFDSIVGTLDEYFRAQRKQTLWQGIIYNVLYEKDGEETRKTLQIVETDSVALEAWLRMSDDERNVFMESDTMLEGFTRYKFDALENSKYDANELIDRFLVLKATRLDEDSLVQLCGVGEAKFVTATERVFEASLESIGSRFRPKVRIVYPLSPLEKKTVEITADVPVDKAVSKMAVTLLASFIVALLLVFCLVYQMATIRRQQRIAELQKNFTLTMLHELKRPLGALKLFVSFMKSEKMSEADRSEALMNASREIDNLSSYFNKLRAITYHEASEVPISPTSFNLKEAVEESAAMVSAATITLQGQADAVIIAERQSIVNVLCNLIENAVKYSKTFEKFEHFENLENIDKIENLKNVELSPPPIEISWQLLDNCLILSVADRGRGIPDADKPLIFDQFYRAEKSADIPGMGLGLAYVRQVVEAHGGTITVKDRDGCGTIFTINLPQ